MVGYKVDNKQDIQGFKRAICLMSIEKNIINEIIVEPNPNCGFEVGLENALALNRYRATRFKKGNYECSIVEPKSKAENLLNRVLSFYFYSY